MPQLYGIEHLLYLGSSVALSVAALILIVKKVQTEQGINVIIKLASAVLLAFIVWNRVSIAMYSNDLIDLIPSSYCGGTSFALAVCGLLLKRDSKAFHCLTYMAIVGGLATIIYPDFIAQADSIFFSKTISGLLHHSMELFLAVLMLATGYVKPTIRRWYCLPLGLCCYVTFGMLLIQVLGTSDSTMNLFSPIVEGTPLTWYTTGAILITVHTVALTINHFVRKCVAAKHKKTDDANPQIQSLGV